MPNPAIAVLHAALLCFERRQAVGPTRRVGHHPVAILIGPRHVGVTDPNGCD
jgi:hypothetical protein